MTHSDTKEISEAPLLSIVIVSYNAQALLRTCLTSIRAAADTLTLELLVVDNASTDQSVAMVASEFPEVILITNQTNRGFAAANNQGLARATGRYLMVLNPDTVVHSGALSRLVAFLDQYPQVGAVGPLLVDARGYPDPHCARRMPTLISELWERTSLTARFPGHALFDAHRLAPTARPTNGPVELLSGAALMVRRAVLQTVGLFDERFWMYGDDVEWCWRIHQAGWHIWLCTEATITHLGGGSSGGGNTEGGHDRLYLAAIQSMHQFFAFHRGWLAATAHRGLIAATELIFWGYFALRPPTPHTRARRHTHGAVLRWALGGQPSVMGVL